MKLFHDPQRLAFAAVALAFLIIRVAYLLRWRNMPARLAVSSVADQVLLVAIIPFGTAVIPATWVFSGLLDFADYARPIWCAFAGAATMVVGVLMFWRTHAELGGGYSGFLRVIEGAPLVTTGLYSRMRHPMYLAMAVYALGQLLLIPNWLAGPSNAVVVVCICLIRVPTEEDLLIKAFGEAYVRYQTQTGVLLPRWRGTKAAD